MPLSQHVSDSRFSERKLVFLGFVPLQSLDPGRHGKDSRGLVEDPHGSMWQPYHVGCSSKFAQICARVEKMWRNYEKEHTKSVWCVS